MMFGRIAEMATLHGEAVANRGRMFFMAEDWVKDQGAGLLPERFNTGGPISIRAAPAAAGQPLCCPVVSTAGVRLPHAAARNGVSRSRLHDSEVRRGAWRNTPDRKWKCRCWLAPAAAKGASGESAQGRPRIPGHKRLLGNDLLVAADREENTPRLPALATGDAAFPA